MRVTVHTSNSASLDAVSEDILNLHTAAVSSRSLLTALPLKRVWSCILSADKQGDRFHTGCKCHSSQMIVSSEATAERNSCVASLVSKCLSVNCHVAQNVGTRELHQS